MLVAPLPHLEAKANTEWQKEISVTATRGDILDRNESILVSSANVYRLDFDLDAIKTHMKKNEVTKEEIAKQIAGAHASSVIRRSIIRT